MSYYPSCHSLYSAFLDAASRQTRGYRASIDIPRASDSNPPHTWSSFVIVPRDSALGCTLCLSAFV